MRRLVLPLLTILLWVSACAAGAPFVAGRPVEVERAAVASTYRQDGEALSTRSLLDGLEGIAAAQDDARAARHWFQASLVAGGLGGGAMGFGLVEAVRQGGTTAWTLVAVGAGLSGASLLLAHLGDLRLQLAVEQYRAGAPPESASSSGPRILPWATGIQERAGRRTAAFGIQIPF